MAVGGLLGALLGAYNQAEGARLDEKDQYRQIQAQQQQAAFARNQALLRMYLERQKLKQDADAQAEAARHNLAQEHIGYLGQVRDAPPALRPSIFGATGLPNPFAANAPQNSPLTAPQGPGGETTPQMSTGGSPANSGANGAIPDVGFGSTPLANEGYLMPGPGGDTPLEFGLSRIVGRDLLQHYLALQKDPYALPGEITALGDSASKALAAPADIAHVIAQTSQAMADSNLTQARARTEDVMRPLNSIGKQRENLKAQNDLSLQVPLLRAELGVKNSTANYNNTLSQLAVPKFNFQKYQEGRILDQGDRKLAQEDRRIQIANMLAEAQASEARARVANIKGFGKAQVVPGPKGSYWVNDGRGGKIMVVPNPDREVKMRIVNDWSAHKDDYSDAESQKIQQYAQDLISTDAQGRHNIVPDFVPAGVAGGLPGTLRGGNAVAPPLMQFPVLPKLTPKNKPSQMKDPTLP